MPELEYLVSFEERYEEKVKELFESFGGRMTLVGSTYGSYPEQTYTSYYMVKEEHVPELKRKLEKLSSDVCFYQQDSCCESDDYDEPFFSSKQY
jgi:hypothetical protein